MQRCTSWGNYPDSPAEHLREMHWRNEPLPPIPEGSTVLPYGMGRSYGDSCLNAGGTLLRTRGLARFIEFDEQSGRLRCESGVSLAEILELALPRGWFLPVSPGTKFVSLGGAIANDIHGKNHHRRGTLGRHVRCFELLRSDGQRLFCDAQSNSELFRATIGGLGLTGLITWAEITLSRVESEFIEMESIRFENLDEFFDLASESDRDFEYTVAWVDCLARGRGLGRGIFLRGNHAAAGDLPRPRRPRRLDVPCFAPAVLLNPLSIRLFNGLYYRKQASKLKRQVQEIDSFFYPLDRVGHWNRLYGRRGFLQYQSVIPVADGARITREMFSIISDRREGSFLAVLKLFGDSASPGMLSFPMPGITLALDFANRGQRTLELLEQLDRLVCQAGGRIYPAKDARMSAGAFQHGFPRWREFSACVDPAFSSSLWRRVSANVAD